jgi:hypothetical protein
MAGKNLVVFFLDKSRIGYKMPIYSPAKEQNDAYSEEFEFCYKVSAPALCFALL